MKITTEILKLMACLYLKHSGVPTMTSLQVTFNSKKIHKDKIFNQQIYYNFSQEYMYPKITNMYR